MATRQSTKSPAFQFYPKDFLSSSKVQRMTLAEVGIYTLLLCHCWLDNGLSPDIHELAKIVKLSQKQFDRLWRGPLSECFSERAGRLHNSRLDCERKKQGDFRRRQADKADKRWEKHRDTPGNAKAGITPAMPRHCRDDALHSPISNLQSAVPTPDGVGKRATLVQPRRKDAAFESGRLYVPSRVHADLLMLNNHPGGEAGLWAFYEQICEEWTTGAKHDTRIDADLIRFWKARYAERWPSASATSTHPKGWDSWKPADVS